jgi:hypothetical protein
MAPARVWLLASFLLLQAPRVLAQDVTEDAAVLLYNSGVQAYLAGNHIEAYGLLNKAFLLRRNEYVQYYLALTLEKLNQCRDAEPHLVALDGKLPPEQEKERRRALGRCLLDDTEAMALAGDCLGASRTLNSFAWPLEASLEARRVRLVGVCEVEAATRSQKAGGCHEALLAMEALHVALIPDLEARRDKIIDECRRTLVGFEPDTPARKAGFMLVLQAMRELDQGDTPRGLAILEKAWAVCEEPIIAAHLSRARLDQLDCRAALRFDVEAVRADPAASEALSEVRRWCDTYDVPTDAPLAAKERKSLLEAYRAATRGPSPDVDRLAATLVTYDNPKVSGVVAFGLFAAGRFSEAVPYLEACIDRCPYPRGDLAIDLEMARFAAVDQNPEPDKPGLYKAFIAARAKLQYGDAAVAEESLARMPANPYVARLLAGLHASRGECATMEPELARAEVLAGGQAWSDGLRKECAGRAAAIAAERAEHQAQEARRLEVQARLDEASRRARTGWLLVAGGVVAAAGSGLLFWRYSVARSYADSAYANYRATAPQPGSTVDWEALREQPGNYATAANGYLAGGISAALAGAALASWGVYKVVRARDGIATGNVLAVPALSGGAGGLVLMVEF